MSHPQQLRFFEECINFFHLHDKESKVLEIGSYDVNGSIRKLFNSNLHTGLDLCHGPGVDIVYDGVNFKLDNYDYDLIVSSECFEHNPFWIENFASMIEVAEKNYEKNSLIILSCASTGRAEHGTKRTEPKHSPGTQSIGSNYYKNLTDQDFYSQFDISQIFSSHMFHYHKTTCDLYFVGSINKNIDFINFKKSLIEALKEEDNKIPKKGKIFKLLSSIEDFLVINPLLKLSPNFLYQEYIFLTRKITRSKLAMKLKETIN